MVSLLLKRKWCKLRIYRGKRISNSKWLWKVYSRFSSSSRIFTEAWLLINSACAIFCNAQNRTSMYASYNARKAFFTAHGQLCWLLLLLLQMFQHCELYCIYLLFVTWPIFFIKSWFLLIINRNFWKLLNIFLTVYEDMFLCFKRRRKSNDKI